MTMKLFIQAITKYLLGVLLVGILVFVPAGKLSFINGWIFMSILFVPMFFAGFIIAKRIRGEEKLLENELEGYKEYKEKVKYRLIPFVW